MISAVRNFGSAVYSALPEAIAIGTVCYAAFRAFGYLNEFQRLLRRDIPAALRLLQIHLDQVRDLPRPMPAVPEPAPPSPVGSDIRAASLHSFIQEDSDRKFTLEKESARLAGKKPREKRTLPVLPEGEVCSLMCSELKPEWAVNFHDAYFDVRYFVKGMLTQKDPVSPYTKAPLSPEELTQLCDPMGIDPDDFLSIWLWPKEYLPSCRELIQIGIEKDPEMIRLQNEMELALRFQRNAEYNQLSQTRARFISLNTNDAMRTIEEMFRKIRFIQLLELAETTRQISPEILKSFKEAIPLENPLDAQNR